MMMIVIKLSGKVTEDSEALEQLTQEIAHLSRQGHPIVVVHGGGKQLSRMARRMGLEQKQVNGRRITDAATLELAKMVFAGSIQTDIVAALRKHGASGVGLSGVDAQLIQARKRPVWQVSCARQQVSKTVDFGFVGDILHIDASLLNLLVNASHIPVSSITDANGTQVSFEYDSRGRLIKESVNAGAE
ncbi:MAG: hypothetical protein AAGJ35_10315, partial [Myxococcota bacterium]